ncbi:MAG: M48 family peptidase [Alphaproteobacteria bacterium]|nr:M48 family peptidase [Alphaproteobacteria bacterium]
MNVYTTSNMQYSITINNREFPIMIRRHATSKRMVVRYQPLQSCVTLTLPRYVSARQGVAFVHSKQQWLENQIDTHPQRTEFSDGKTIPILGQNYIVRHVGGRGVVEKTEGEILVHGDAAFMERRLRAWIIACAREEISVRAAKKASIIGKKFTKVSMRDNSSCWGSCNRLGHLSFSWRLIFAAPEILDYVVAHEVAHLAHLDHSKAFWSVVAQLCPHWEHYRHWLKTHGKTLYAFG